MTAFDYNAFVARNSVYIDSTLQYRIKKARLCFAGCGMASTAAEVAVRTGFTKLLLADGDRVELSNLNRQIFRGPHVGSNKARAAADILNEINPELDIVAIDRYVTESDVTQLVNNSDFLINTVDAGPLYFQLTKEAQKAGAVALLPLNIGYGSAVMVFSKESLSLDEMIDPKAIKTDGQLFAALFGAVKNYRAPNYIAVRAEEILRGVQETGMSPQLCVGAYTAATLVVVTILKLLLGEPIPLVPEVVSIDTFDRSV